MELWGSKGKYPAIYLLMNEWPEALIRALNEQGQGSLSL